MDERLRFVGECMRGERSMSALCMEFGISRKTGYRLLHRYRLEGLLGLFDRSRSPHCHPQAVSDDLVEAILGLRERHPRWGPRKLRAWLDRNRPRTSWPSASTIGRILLSHGKTAGRGRRRRTPPYSQPFRTCLEPNAVWCADFKGWFRTADGARCQPLTVSDAHSRFLLVCRALPATTQGSVRPVMEAAFREYGLPWAIRTDNGAPFASTALGGLSRLAVWWIKLGIMPERIDPGCPEQNGRHERLHRTLKEETASPPRPSLSQQQLTFDRFCQEYNYDRPHEALANHPPGQIYRSSTRPYPSRIPEILYPDHMIIRIVRPSGQLHWQGQEFYVSETLIGEPVAFEPIDDRFYQLYYGPVKIARYDNDTKKLIKPKPMKRKRR
ncbi:MAG: IS481 family transposase [bacterium]